MKFTCLFFNHLYSYICIDVFVKVYLEEISKYFQHVHETDMSNESVKELDVILFISLRNQPSERLNLLDDIISCFNILITVQLLDYFKKR